MNSPISIYDLRPDDIVYLHILSDRDREEIRTRIVQIVPSPISVHNVVFTTNFITLLNELSEGERYMFKWDDIKILRHETEIDMAYVNVEHDLDIL